MNKIIKGLVLLVMILSCMIPVYSAGNDALQNTLEIDANQAYQICINHITQDMKLSDESFSKSIKLHKTTELYDFDGEKSAYLFEFTDKNDRKSGYVLVGANESYPPIIEYSYDGEPFIYKAIAQVSDQDKSFKNKDKTIYYTGMLNYFISEKGNKNEVFNISSSDNVKKVKIKDIKSDYTHKLKKDSEGWKHWKNKLAYASGNESNPPQGTTITNLSAHEYGYSSVDFDNVTGCAQTYKTTYDYPGKDHCGPVAGTNLMLYWYYRDPNKYGRLYKNNSWNDVFSELYSSMKMAQNNTTYTTDFEKAIDSYFSSYANGVKHPKVEVPVATNLFQLLFSCYTLIDTYGFSSPSESVSVESIKSDITSNYPPVLLLQAHKLYGNHYVLALGYCTFYYTGSGSSTYIRIADGRSSTSRRYIHYNAGYNSGGKILMLSVYPN